MDKKCDKLLDDILNEVERVFKATRAAYLNRGNHDDYIERLNKLTCIVMSVKTGIVLSKPPAYFGTSDSSKEEPV